MGRGKWLWGGSVAVTIGCQASNRPGAAHPGVWLNVRSKVSRSVHDVPGESETTVIRATCDFYRVPVSGRLEASRAAYERECYSGPTASHGDDTMDRRTGIIKREYSETTDEHSAR
jgi:hypothetical protein